MAIDIGISEEDRKSIVDGLSRLLSDTYVLYLKTHNFHWNVTGPMFRTLHLMFEEQYNELALAVDSIAERIRALGFPAPGAYSIYARLSSIKEEEGVPSAEEMIKRLVAGQEAVTRTARGIFPLLDKVSDEPTADLLTQRMQVHEKPRGCCAPARKPVTVKPRRRLGRCLLVSCASWRCPTTNYSPSSGCSALAAVL